MHERTETAGVECVSGQLEECAASRPSSCRIVDGGPRCRLAEQSGAAAAGIAKAASARPLWTSMIYLRAWLNCDVSVCRSTNCISVPGKAPRSWMSITQQTQKGQIYILLRRKKSEI